MSSMRNSGYVDDDETIVTGISKRHRIRRKKSALAAITPDERERNEWTKSVYASVMSSEQVKWQTSIYAHVLNSETTHTKNMEAKRKLEEQSLAEQRRLENKKRLDKMAKKFAARAEQFHKIRQEGGDDDESLVSGTSRLKRRRNRKSISRPSLVTSLLEESAGGVVAIADAPSGPAAMMEEGEDLERKQWCTQVYLILLHADQSQWMTSVYHHVLEAEAERTKRMELDAMLEKQRVASEAMKEKIRQNELRVKKMERIAKERQEANVETRSHDDYTTALSNGHDPFASPTRLAAPEISSLKNMRNRRKMAAKKNASK